MYTYIYIYTSCIFYIHICTLYTNIYTYIYIYMCVCVYTHACTRKTAATTTVTCQWTRWRTKGWRCLKSIWQVRARVIGGDTQAHKHKIHYIRTYSQHAVALYLQGTYISIEWTKLTSQHHMRKHNLLLQLWDKVKSTRASNSETDMCQHISFNVLFTSVHMARSVTAMHVYVCTCSASTEGLNIRRCTQECSKIALSRVEIHLFANLVGQMKRYSCVKCLW